MIITGAHIRQARIDAGISLRKLSELLDCSPVLLGEIERQVKMPAELSPTKGWPRLFEVLPALAAVRDAEPPPVGSVLAAYPEVAREMDNEAAVLRACADLSDEQLRWYQNSGPFRHICQAEMKRRGIV